MKKEVIIIHGLNNNKSSFYPLKKALAAKGYKVHLFALAGHRTLKPNLSIEDSVAYLANQFNRLSHHKKYICIGFSQGGLMLQLLPPEIKKRIYKQILLAPALAVRQSFYLEKLVDVLPNSLPLVSLVPKNLRKFSWMSVSYFDLLFKLINTFKTIRLNDPEIPTTVLIDPKDELIDVDELSRIVSKQSLWRINLVDRSYLNFIHIGQHHALFHPEYFSKEEWNNFIQQICDYCELD